jgi:hypothetical protein
VTGVDNADKLDCMRSLGRDDVCLAGRDVQHPEDRREAARSYIESVGGTLPGF